MNKKQRNIILFSLIGLVFVLLFGILVKKFIIDSERDKKIHTEKNINEDETTTEEEFKYVQEDLKVREGPGTENEILGTIPQGEEVKIIKKDNDWYKLEYNDLIGYSSSEYLEDPPTIINGVLLVNRDHGVPANYYKDIDPEAKEQLDKMLKAAKDEENLDLITHSDHRTHNDQKILFENYAKRDGYDAAYMYSAQPGQSEHETGLAFDICDSERKYYLKESFGESEEGIWLKENANRFGFILRYPKDKTDITEFIYEPWHFRYIGIDHATEIYEKGITLEEYLLPDEY